MNKKSWSFKNATDASIRHKHTPGLLVVRWKEDIMEDVPVSSRRASSLTLPDQVASRLQYLKDNCGLKQVIDLDTQTQHAHLRKARASMARHTSSIAKSLEPSRGALRGITVLEIDPAKVNAAVKSLKNAAIEYAEPAAARWAAVRKTAIDPKYNLQWSLPAIEWPGVKRPNASAINVAVLDSGVDAGHPDLKRAVAFYDHNGASATDLLGHGTHVTGIIAAALNNRIGIAGIANCKIHCWKVFGDAGNADYIDNVAYYRALGAVLDSAGKDAIRIVNLSLGGTERDATERLLIRKLIQKGVMVVAAMGNEYEANNPVEFPAALPGVVSVGAIMQNMVRAPFSNTGKHIDIVAPGVAILSTLPRKKSRVRKEVMYDSWDGTSMATPIVSAAAALVWAKYPHLSAEEVRDRVTKHRNTTALPDMRGKRRTNQYGNGLLNLKRTLL